MTKEIIEELKSIEDSWKLSIKLRTEAYKTASIFLKEKERDFNNAKRVKNLTYRQLKESKEMFKKAREKRVSYPSRVRRWTKSNFGKVLDKMEEMGDIEEEKQEMGE
jgi:hypothetical protein